MYILAAGIVILLIVLAGADLFLAQFNADELSNMGVEKPWSILTPILHKPGGYRTIRPGILFNIIFVAGVLFKARQHIRWFEQDIFDAIQLELGTTVFGK